MDNRSRIQKNDTHRSESLHLPTLSSETVSQPVASTLDIDNAFRNQDYSPNQLLQPSNEEASLTNHINDNIELEMLPLDEVK